MTRAHLPHLVTITPAGDTGRLEGSRAYRVVGLNNSGTPHLNLCPLEGGDGLCGTGTPRRHADESYVVARVCHAPPHNRVRRTTTGGEEITYHWHIGGAS